MYVWGITISFTLNYQFIAFAHFPMGLLLFYYRKHSCHKGNGCGDLRANNGKRWDVEDWRGPRKASTLLTIMFTTRKPSEVTDSRTEVWVSKRKPHTESVACGMRETVLLVGWLWFGADFLVLCGSFVVCSMKGIQHLNVFLITLRCFDWISRYFPQGISWEGPQKSSIGSSSDY